MADAYHAIGDHRQELEEVRRGQSQQTNPRFITAQEKRALAALGWTEELNVRAQQKSSDSTSAPAMVNLAVELRAHGYGVAATEMLNRAIEWLQYRSPEQKARPSERWTTADVFLAVGRLDEAQVLLEGLLEDGGPQYRTGWLAQLGIVAARRGDREEASRISRILEDADRRLSAGVLGRAQIAVALGERERAMELLRQLRFDGEITEGLSNRGRVSGLWILHKDPLLEPLWDYPPFKELLRTTQ